MDDSSPLRSLTWMLAIVAAGLGFSFGFACATPFAALAAIGGTRLRRGQAIAAVVLAWLGNQAIGYVVLHYPRTWDSFAWGGAIGVAAILATLGAIAVAAWTTRPIVRGLAAFAVAVLAYEGALYAAGWVLPGEGNAFAPWIVARIAEINAIAYAGLLAACRAAAVVGVPIPQAATQRA